MATMTANLRPQDIADMHVGLMNPSRLMDEFPGPRGTVAGTRELSAFLSLLLDSKDVKVRYVANAPTWAMDLGSGTLTWTDTLLGGPIYRWQAVNTLLHEWGHKRFTGEYDMPSDVVRSAFHTLMNAAEDPRMEALVAAEVPVFSMVSTMSHAWSFAARADGPNPVPDAMLHRVTLRLMAQVWDTDGRCPDMGPEAEAVAAASAADYAAAITAPTTDAMVPYVYRIYGRLMEAVQAQQEQAQQEQAQQEQAQQEQENGDPDAEGDGTPSGTGDGTDGDSTDVTDGTPPEDPERTGYAATPDEPTNVGNDREARERRDADAGEAWRDREERRSEWAVKQADELAANDAYRKYDERAAEKHAANVKPHATRLMRGLRRVLTDNSEGTFMRDEKAGRIDAGRLHRLHHGRTDVFRDRIGPSGITDWSVVVLADLSDSTRGPSGGYRNSPYSYPAIREAAMMMLMATRTTHGVDVAVAGYNSGVSYVIPFGMKHDKALAHAAAQRPGGGTDEAIALEWARRYSLRHRSKGKIILVLTDGAPNDPAATEQVALACRADGILTAGIGIGTDAPIYHPVARSITDVADLTRVAPEVVRSMMRGRA